MNKYNVKRKKTHVQPHINFVWIFRWILYAIIRFYIICPCINVRQVPKEMLKNEGEASGSEPGEC